MPCRKIKAGGKPRVDLNKVLGLEAAPKSPVTTKYMLRGGQRKNCSAMAL
jgi:hypothetical protein